MNILTIANLNPKKYGSFEKYCIIFTNFLIKKGNKHIVCFLKEPIPIVKEKLTVAGARVCVQDFGNFGIISCIQLFKIISKYKIDIIHIHYYEPYSLFSLLIYFFKTKYFVSYRMGLYKIKRPVVIKFLKILRARLLGIGINKIFCVSKYSQEIVLNNYQERYQKTKVIYNGIDLTEYENLYDEKSDDEFFRIICVAKLIPEKGVQYLIKSIPFIIKKNSTCRFLIVGDGPFRQSLENLAMALGVKNYIEFLGQRNDIPQLLLKADIAVIPSVVPEGFGFTVAEAMAASLPIVATNVGSIPELVVHGKNSFIVEPVDEYEIFEALNLLIKNKDLRDNMAKENKKRIYKLFDIKRACEEQLRCFIDSD
ncbi:putative Glycosyl transferase family 1 domain-containing protein [Candidatus Magnetomoraceae bacterium gMMP-13]